jgi:hypothetical protein
MISVKVLSVKGAASDTLAAMHKQMMAGIVFMTRKVNLVAVIRDGSRNVNRGNRARAKL